MVDVFAAGQVGDGLPHHDVGTPGYMTVRSGGSPGNRHPVAAPRTPAVSNIEPADKQEGAQGRLMRSAVLVRAEDAVAGVQRFCRCHWIVEKARMEIKCCML